MKLTFGRIILPPITIYNFHNITNSYPLPAVGDVEGLFVASDGRQGL